MTTTTDRTNILTGLTLVSVVLFIAASVMSFAYPGPDVDQGEVQRLFYIHLGAFFGAFAVFLSAMVAGVQYLRTRQVRWDHLGLASVEIGLGLSAITIVTGAIWARPTWGTFWTWDPRLTTIAIMWLTYAAYLFLRSSLDNLDMQRRFAAVYAIFAFGTVILTIIIIRVRPDVIHPTVAGPTVNEVGAKGDFGLSPRITQTVLFNIVTYIVLSITLTWYRVRLEQRAEQVRARKMEILANL